MPFTTGPCQDRHVDNELQFLPFRGILMEENQTLDEGVAFNNAFQVLWSERI